MLDFVAESLSTLSNERRREIKLGEFLARHPLVNTDDSFSAYANRIIREKLEQVLGKPSAEMVDGKKVEWDFNGYVSNPFTAQYRSELIQAAAK